MVSEIKNGRKGLLFVSLLSTLSHINANGFKGNDQKSLDYYASLSSLQLKMNPDLAAKLYEVRNAKVLDVNQIIKNSTVSQMCQDFTLKILENVSNLNKEDKLKYFEKLSKDVKNSKLKEEEKSLNLMLISIANTSYESNRNNRDKGCTVEGQYGPQHLDATECVLMGAAIGAYLGWEICGPWCAVGGAVLIGVITAIAVC